MNTPWPVSRTTVFALIMTSAAVSGSAEGPVRSPASDSIDAAQIATLGLSAVPTGSSGSHAPTGAADRDGRNDASIDAQNKLWQKKLIEIVAVDGAVPGRESERINLAPGDHLVSMVLKPAPVRYCFFVDDCVFAANSLRSQQDLCFVNLVFTAQMGHYYEIRWSTKERGAAADRRALHLHGTPPRFEYQFRLLDRTQSDAVVGQASCRPDPS